MQLKNLENIIFVHFEVEFYDQVELTVGYYGQRSCLLTIILFRMGFHPVFRFVLNKESKYTALNTKSQFYLK